MSYSNAHILAAVVSHWARPAITQLAASRLASLPLMQSLQQSLVGSGFVSQAYNISSDILPMMTPLVNNLLQPYLERQFSQIPDDVLPGLAHDIIAEAERIGKYTVMDGFLTFENEDIRELRQLLEKNLPVTPTAGYEIIK